MKRTSFAEMQCPIARTLETVGDDWSLLILRDLFAGVSRFEELREDLGISRKVLSERLAWLTENGVIERVAYQQRPARYSYQLTERGSDLAGVLLALHAWGDRWVFERTERPVRLRHLGCGNLANPVAICSNCGEPLEPGEVVPEEGPGLKREGGAQAAAARARIQAAARALP